MVNKILKSVNCWNCINVFDGMQVAPCMPRGSIILVHGASSCMGRVNEFDETKWFDVRVVSAVETVTRM